MTILRMCLGRAWRHCWRSTGCARQAANWPSNSAGILRRRWTICWESKTARSTTRACIAVWIASCRTRPSLERHLKNRYGELFGAEFDVLLYDLTSTYVEGAAEKNPMVRRGYSRDHRPDCEQIVIALIVNTEGFPVQL